MGRKSDGQRERRKERERESDGWREKGWIIRLIDRRN